MDITNIFKFLTFFAHNFTISSQNGKFLNKSALHHSWYLYTGYELPLCKILYQCINKYEYYQDFLISRDFSLIEIIQRLAPVYWYVATVATYQ